MPLGLHSAIAVLSSILIFPSTVSAQFTTRLQAVLTPLIKSLDLHRALLKISTDSPEFVSTSADIVSAVSQSEGALIPLSATGRLLESDLIWSRFSPSDFRPFQQISRRMATRANGMTIYFTLIDPTREKFPVTPAPSRPGTPGASTPGQLSRAPSLEVLPELAPPVRVESGDTSSMPSTPKLPQHQAYHPHLRKHRAHSVHAHSHSHSHGHNHRHFFHNSLFHIPVPHVHKDEHAVGVFESQRYLDIEAHHLSDHNAAVLTEQMVELLHKSCDSLLGQCQDSLSFVQTWLRDVRRGRWRFWISGKERRRTWKKKSDEVHQLREALSATFEKFRSENRSDSIYAANDLAVYFILGILS